MATAVLFCSLQYVLFDLRMLGYRILTTRVVQAVTSGLGEMDSCVVNPNVVLYRVSVTFVAIASVQAPISSGYIVDLP